MRRLARASGPDCQHQSLLTVYTETEAVSSALMLATLRQCFLHNCGTMGLAVDGVLALPPNLIAQSYIRSKGRQRLNIFVVSREMSPSAHVRHLLRV